MNETETKFSMRYISNRRVPMPTLTSSFYQCEAESEYEKKKAAEKKAIHEQIKRASLQQSLI